MSPTLYRALFYPLDYPEYLKIYMAHLDKKVYRTILLQEL